MKVISISLDEVMSGLENLSMSQLEAAWNHLYKEESAPPESLKSISQDEWIMLESLLLWLLLQKEESSLH